MSNESDFYHQQFYQEALKKFGVHSVQSMHWNSLESQRARFFSLKRVGDLKNHSVLDLGCGRGDFLEFLINCGQAPQSYIGVDFMKEFIDYAKKKFPFAQFYYGDFFQFQYVQYDYVICNGALNFLQDNNLLFLKKFFQFFVPCAKKGFGLTLLKNAEGYIRNPLIYLYRVQDVQKILQSLQFKYTVYQDYADNDFTIIIQ